MFNLAKGLLYSALLGSTLMGWGDIRVVPKERSPEPNNVELDLIYPTMGEVKEAIPVQVQFRLMGYNIMTNTELPRAKEIYNTPKGQSVHVLIDNIQCFVINEAMIDALDDNNDYYMQFLQATIPCHLSEGMHVLRAFPTTSFNESTKGRNSFIASVFYVKEKKDNPAFSITGPYLTYNQPEGLYPYSSTRPILLDFLIRNCQLSSDGYKVRLSIDDHVEMVLTEWIPYYIYGLSKGTHKIRLELLNPQGKVVPGAFNDVTQIIKLE